LIIWTNVFSGGFHRRLISTFRCDAIEDEGACPQAIVR
jgi:hypothetical protein